MPEGRGSAHSIYMLSLLAEADQRGRNSQDSTPLDRIQVKDLEGWQNWLIEKAQKLDVKDKAPAPILIPGKIVTFAPITASLPIVTPCKFALVSGRLG